MQAHFSRSGLNMLVYDPRHEERALYLFDDDGRRQAKNQLMDDILRLVSDAGDAVTVLQFYKNIYNVTPAHAHDIHGALIENPDMEIITPTGGARRKANPIGIRDVIKLRRRSSFFPLF